MFLTLTNDFLLKENFVQRAKLEATQSSSSGFTLIELLVAMTIFAIMSTAMYTVFSSYQQTKEITDRDARRLADLQRFFAQFGREIQQTVQRPVRDEQGSDERLPAMSGTREIIEFTRAGWNQPPFATTLRSELQRISYGLEEGKLVRVQWKVLDRAEDTAPTRVPILDNVTEVSFKYFEMDGDGNITDTDAWPSQLLQNNASTGAPPATPGAPPPKEVVLPLLVQINLKLPDVGDISRSFMIASKR